ncbi:MAG: ion transporter [Microbacteriaceae bacterium]
MSQTPHVRPDEYSEEPDAAPVNSPLARYEHRTSVILFLLAVLWIAALSWHVLNGPTGRFRETTQTLLYVLWAVFVADYLVRYLLAVHKRAFLRESVFDLASVIIPMLRPFHVLGYFRSLPYFRNPTQRAFRVRVIVYSLSFVIVFVYTVSLYVLEAERDAPGANITSLGNSLWWAATTVSTVGYGDVYPVTITGRLLAALLMLGGIVFVGVASALSIQILTERARHISQVHHGRQAPDASDASAPAPTAPVASKSSAAKSGAVKSGAVKSSTAKPAAKPKQASSSRAPKQP